MMRSIPGGMLRPLSARSGGSSFRIAFMVSTAESPWNARRPESISKRIAPKLKRSERGSIAAPRTCSGDMYPAVPMTTPGSVPRGAVGRFVCGCARGLRLGQLREAEVEDLDSPVGGDEDVFGLQVPVHDPLLVRRGETGRDGARVLERPADRERTAGEARPQRFSLEQLRHDVGRALVGSHVVDREDVRVVQLPGRLGLQLEAPQPVGVGRERRRQDFDRDLALQAGVARPVDLAHSAGAERRDDFIRSETGSRRNAHDFAKDILPENRGATSDRTTGSPAHARAGAGKRPPTSPRRARCSRRTWTRSAGATRRRICPPTGSRRSSREPARTASRSDTRRTRKRPAKTGRTRSTRATCSSFRSSRAWSTGRTDIASATERTSRPESPSGFS